MSLVPKYDTRRISVPLSTTTPPMYSPADVFSSGSPTLAPQPFLFLPRSYLSNPPRCRCHRRPHGLAHYDSSALSPECQPTMATSASAITAATIRRFSSRLGSIPIKPSTRTRPHRPDSNSGPAEPIPTSAPPLRSIAFPGYTPSTTTGTGTAPQNRATIASPVDLHDPSHIQRGIPILRPAYYRSSCPCTYLLPAFGLLRILYLHTGTPEPEHGCRSALQYWSPVLSDSQQCDPLDRLGTFLALAPPSQPITPLRSILPARAMTPSVHDRFSSSFSYIDPPVYLVRVV